MKLLLLICFTIFSAQALSKNVTKAKPLPKITAAKKAEYVSYLKESCVEAQKSKRAIDKTKKICSCYEKEIKKLEGKQLQHLVLAARKKGKLSQLSTDEAQQLEDYDFQVAAKCMGDDLSQPKTKTK